MKKIIKKMKGKKVLSVLLALIMVLTVASPAFSPLMGVIAKAAASYTVELAFDNLFVFDHWVTNGNSMIIDNDYGTANAGTITNIDLENGSFRFNNNTNHNIYTRAAAGTGEKTEENFDYYRMPVEEGATYTFSCNFTGTSPAFYPFVFFYNESNEFTGTLINGTFTGEGDHSFNFTVPEGASYIQLRLTIAGNDTKDAYAVIKDIAVSRYKFEMDSTNLFSLDSWVGSEKSDQPATSLVAYNDGQVTPQDSNNDGSYDRLYFETNVDANNGVGLFFTDFDYTSYEGYYSMDVKPNTDYTLSYNISGGNALDFQPYIVRYDSNGKFIDFINYVTLNYGVSNFTFTTTADTEYIAVVFSISHQNQSWNLTVQDIGVYETTITDYTVDPVRETYTYNSSNNGTYGTLPTPPAETYPEGYIFAGWYTGKDGTGTRIASDTKILPQSMTVYPKFEPAVSSLTVKTSPAKTTYTVGEKINIAGLVLTATIDDGTGSEGSVNTFDISSGFYIDPEYAQDTAGTQNITVHYGGKTATFPITVSDGDDKNIIVNGNTHAVKVANNNYTINYQATAPFNRYEMTYSSDSYVKGEIVMDGVTEEFFLEPSGNGSFSSYIDSFLRGVNHYNIDSIKFTCLDNEFGNFELLSLTTIAATIPSNPTQYYENTETGYKVGIDLSFGGVVSEIYDLNHTGIESRVYNIDGKNVTKVDYASILDENYGTNYISRETGNINLINKFDRGRYLQQSYYGTSQKPYELGDYNGQDWPYNPVQGGNLVINNADGTTKGNEASKVIDYRITDNQIYVKTRPLDWGKNSVDYPDSYVTDSYMEAWYVFEDNMIKTYCRFVDFSGYPSHTRDQELPAVYIIEPLNHFVYNDVSTAWTDADNLVKITEPEFWGVLPEYNALLVANGQAEVDPTVDCYENWAAFAASDDENSFGVGVYSAGATDFHYGCFYPKYNETEAKNGNLVETENRHAVTLTPAEENPTSYISPVGNMTFESYAPIEYSYYITTGTAEEINNDFETIANKDNQTELDKSKIAVPETVYMTPASGASTVGQYYVNNVMDANDSYNIETEAVRDAAMYLGLHVKDAKDFSVKVTNVTPDKGGDIYLCNTSGSAISENTRIAFGAAGTFEDDHTYGLRFSGTGLQPGEKTTAKWEITVYFEDGSTETYTAYTVMYAPGRTVGAVAEARKEDISQNEISSWITGANGVDHSQRAPLGSFHGDYSASGYFKEDPLVYDAPLTNITCSGETADDLINVATEYSDNAYVLQTATNGHDHSRAQSYLGLLKVDKSRYTNTDQIPNLEIGYDVLRVGSNAGRSLANYYTLYTLGTSESFTSTDVKERPSGWTSFATTTNSDSTIPVRETVIPSYSVSDIDGKYIHALNQARCWYISNMGESTGNTMDLNSYATAGTSVLCSVTDKSGLRDSVLEGYNISKDDYSEDSYNKMVEKLQPAATVLGDPSASQEEINNAQKELEDALDGLTNIFYALKYDNLFSAYEMSQYSASMKVVGGRGTASYENGTITVKNDVITGGEAYTEYGSADHFYKVQLKPNTEYVFEYDVTTTLNAQAFMFFYNSSGGAGDVPTNMSIKVDNGNWSAKSESNAWWGNYTNGAGTYHYAIKFTTGANTTQAAFRFGNTSNDPVTSTFSNIRLIDAAHYYEDVDGYTKTEDAYKEYASYGTLPTLSRKGYTFAGWSDENDIGITGATIATQHRTIYSQWDEYTYTIAYNANGGSGSIPSQTVRYTQEATLPSTGFTKDGFELVGWSTDSAATSADYAADAKVSKLTETNKATVTLYAVWAKSSINVTFDNLIDLRKWEEEKTPGSASATFSDTAITLVSTPTADEGTFESHEFAVTAGKEYKIDIDITGDAWDVYIFFRNDTTGGTGINFTDSGNRFSSNGAGNKTRVFTAPEGATKAVIRIDANGSSNTVTFDNIRVWENNGITISPVNKIVANNKEYGTLPTPVRVGYKFNGWKNAGDQWVNASDIVNSSTTINLYSQWTEREYGIFFHTNGGSDKYENISVTYTKDFVLPDNLTAEGAKFLGWAVEDVYAREAVFEGGETISVSQLEGIDADSAKDITFCAVWELTNDSVIEDSVVADFGLGITISPYNNDTGIFGYHAATVATGGYELGFSADGGNTINKTVAGTYGNFSVSGFNVIYTPTTAALGVDEVTLYSKLKYEDGSVKTLTNTVKVVPSSNIYFEDTIMSVKDPSSTKASWSDAGSATNTTLGAPAADDVYGFENAYNVQGAYSNGTVRTVTVNSSNKNSQTQTFDFTGTGIDIVSRCGSNTGMMLISVKKDVDGKMKTVKASIVDTYCAEGTFNQTPVFSWSGDYGTYTVEIGAMYLTTAGGVVNAQKSIKKGNLIDTGIEMNTSTDFDADVLQAMLDDAGVEDVSAEDVELIWFDDNSIFNGGSGVAPTKKGSRADGTETVNLENYIDGFRVYNPLGKAASAYEDYVASEKNVSYANVIDNLAPVNTEGSVIDELFGIAYITGLGENENTVSFAKYQQAGPKGELYLNGGKAISFKINRGAGERVMLGLRAVNGTEKTTVYINDGTGDPVSVDITSATEMYYDITECIDSTAGDVVITITNTHSTNLLAVNHVKFSGGSGSNGAVVTPRSMARSADATEATTNKFLPITQEDLVAIENSMSGEPILAEVRNGVVVPLVEDEEEIPGDDTTPDVPGDDTNNDNNDDTNTDSGETGDFSIFSLLELLISLIEKILHNAFGTGNLF